MITNNLVASTLWYRLVTVIPERGWIEEDQRTILTLFWSGQSSACGGKMSGGSSHRIKDAILLAELSQEDAA